MAMAKAKATAPREAKEELPSQQPPGIFSWLIYASKLSAMQSATGVGQWYKGWADWLSPAPTRPNIVKKYDVRMGLPVRIFFPASYDQTSTQMLPVLFTLHAGGFSIGCCEDDDRWNRTFSDLHKVSVVSLNYSKAPWSPYPTALDDIVALYSAVIEDESLPLDRTKSAILGFSAGGNLALAACQTPALKNHASRPKAVIPVYPPLDFSEEAHAKADRRPYKPSLPGVRGGRDWVIDSAPIFSWAYIPYGANLRDPLISPGYAKRADLPENVFIIAAELDYLAYEALQLAHRLAGKGEVTTTMAGRPEAAVTQELELRDGRFHWEDPHKGVKWLLVPDVVHAFDMHVGATVAGDRRSVLDAEAKTVKYMKVLGDWLRSRSVW